MFDAVRNNKRIVQVFLILITIPFALWGVDWYTRSISTGDAVAVVDDHRITQPEFQQALREQQNRMREALGQEFQASMLDTPEGRQMVIDMLIHERVLERQAADARIMVHDDLLRQFIASVPAFQDEQGRFSMTRYENVARNLGLSPAGFDARLRRDLAVQQVGSPVGDGALVAGQAVDRWIALQREQREVAEAVVELEPFLAQVKLAPEAAKQFYEANRSLFEVPEQVRAEYVVLDPDALLERVEVGEQEIKQWYESHAAQYVQPEERRASHILLSVAPDANEQQKAAVRAKMEDLLKQAKQNPEAFAKLAREHSQDPGSAAKGGDLGFFARGAMVRAFEDAAFGLKEGELSGIVASEFGLHVIKVTGVKPERKRTLEEVKEEIRVDLKRQGAARKFAEAAEQFTNTVYEQPDSLKPAVDAFKLNLHQSGWLTKGAPRAAGELNNERLINALFSEDAIKNKRNTEAIEIGANTMVAARVLEHRPAQLRPFDAVKADIEQKLVRDEAAKLAQQEGERKLAQLLKGEPVELKWGETKPLSRAGAQGMPAEAVKAVFHLPPDKLPGYAGAAKPGAGYALYKLVAVKPADAKADEARLGAVRGQLARLYGEEEFRAYLAVLKGRYEVSINKAALEAR
jgi:peptidyl-prolyl cis-trans isomerase D